MMVAPTKNCATLAKYNSYMHKQKIEKLQNILRASFSNFSFSIFCGDEEINQAMIAISNLAEKNRYKYVQSRV